MQKKKQLCWELHTNHNRHTNASRPWCSEAAAKRPGASWQKRKKITSDCGNNGAGCAFMQHNTRRETSPPSPHKKNDVFVIFSAPCRCFLAVVLWLKIIFPYGLLRRERGAARLTAKAGRWQQLLWERLTAIFIPACILHRRLHRELSREKQRWQICIGGFSHMQMTHANRGRMAGGGQRGRLPSLQIGKKIEKK